MTEDEIFIVDRFISFFARNKDIKQFESILAGDRERIILLNERHNVVELSYFTGQYTNNRKWEIMGISHFGASYEVLDALFAKYRNNKKIVEKLFRFCLRSKCKAYWDFKLKHSELATELMASVLGGKE